MADHECPRPGCARRVRMEQYACRPHWFELPKDIREEIWSTYHNRLQDPAAHAEAMADAGRFYREKDAGTGKGREARCPDCDGRGCAYCNGLGVVEMVSDSDWRAIRPVPNG